MAANSYYAAGQPQASSSQPNNHNQNRYQESEIGWKSDGPPNSPPPSYSGLGNEAIGPYGQQTQQQQQIPPPLQQTYQHQQPQPPLQVYTQGYPPQAADPRVQQDVYHNVQTKPSVGLGAGGKKEKRYHGEGKYPRPGGNPGGVYVDERERDRRDDRERRDRYGKKKTNKDDVALGFCAGCAAACCCCGCVVM